MLTPQEHESLRELEGLLETLRNILNHLLPAHTPSPNVMLDGRHEGGNHELFIELRIDEAVSGVISADLYRNGITGRSYVASIRTNPGVSISRNKGAWSIIGSDGEGRSATGKLELEPQTTDGSALTGSLFLDTALTGLPVRTKVNFAADLVSLRMRRLGIELEREQVVGEVQFSPRR